MKYISLAILAIAAGSQAIPTTITAEGSEGSINNTRTTLEATSTESSLPNPGAIIPPPHSGNNFTTILRPHERLDTIIIKCAMPCIEAYIKKHTKCKVDEYECICKRKEVKDADALKCVIDACGFTRAKNRVYPVVAAFCKPF